MLVCYEHHLIDPSLQDNVIIPSDFSQYIYRVGCASILHSIINSGLIPGGQNLSNRQSSSCLWILWTKVTKILRWLTSMHCVMHNTCIKHGRNIRTLYIGSTSILLLRKNWNSIRLDRMQSFFKKHFQLIVFRKLLEWKLEKSYTRKYTCHLGLRQRSPWNTNGKREFGSEHAQRSEVGQLSRSFPIEPTNTKSNSWEIGATW